MGSERKQRICILRWKVTGKLEKQRMLPSDLHFNRSKLDMESKVTAGRPTRRPLK